MYLNDDWSHWQEKDLPFVIRLPDFFLTHRSRVGHEKTPPRPQNKGIYAWLLGVVMTIMTSALHFLARCSLKWIQSMNDKINIRYIRSNFLFAQKRTIDFNKLLSNKSRKNIDV
jgi:hypothetical protein